MSSKQHKLLRNRNLGDFLTFVINPRENFDIVASNKTQSGIRTRENIRARVKTYNNGLCPKELGFYGDENNLEWHQYQLSEPSVRRPNRCPLQPQKLD